MNKVARLVRTLRKLVASSSDIVSICFPRPYSVTTEPACQHLTRQHHPSMLNRAWDAEGNILMQKTMEPEVDDIIANTTNRSSHHGEPRMKKRA